jgi:Ca-activated chloride channel homolog
MIRFAVPWLLAWAGASLLLVALAGHRWLRRRRRAAAALADAPLLARVAPTLEASRSRPLLWAAAAAALGLAAAGPLLGTEAAPRRSTLPDVVLVLDASNSMHAEDVRPNRLEVQRRLARALVRRLGGTRVGLVVFAGQGYVVSPLTRDMDALDAYVEAMSTEMVPQGGSSLSSAVRQGAGLLLDPASRSPGAVVLVSDGDALEEAGEVERSGQLIAQTGIPVHTVGIGTPGGAPVPDFDPETRRRRGFKREPDGRPARSALGEALLRGLARRTGGSYRVHAGEPEPVAERLVAALPVAVSTSSAWNERRPGNRAPWLIGLALVLLGVDWALAMRAGSRGPS